MIYNFRVPPTSLVAGTNIFFMNANNAASNSRSFMVTELDFEGSLTATQYAEIGIYRASGTTLYSGGSASVGTPVDLPSGSTAGTPATPVAATIAGSSPTTAGALGALVHSFGINANGQRYFWRANPNLNNAIIVVPLAAAQNQIVLSVIGTPTGTISVSGRIQILEL